MLFFPTVDEDVAYFRSQGYTGSINDMHYKAMGDLGYTGALNDRIHAYLTAEFGSFYEAMRDLRNGTSVFSLFSYTVNSLNPPLVFDFIKDYYRKSNTKSTITEALVHNSATAGNATMTDGYGPELVTNGDFTSDSDWTKGSGWTISGGAASSASGLSGSLISPYSGNFVEGKVYCLTVDLNVTIGGNLFLQISGGTSVNIGSAGVRAEVLYMVAGSNTGYDLNIFANTTFVGTIDNISVREAPAIKWRPHNLLKYSEDLTSDNYVDFGDTGYVTFVDPTTITFGAGPANASNNTLGSTALVGQQITGAIELSSQTHAGEEVQLRLNWRGGNGAYGSPYTLTTTPTLVYVTGTVPAGTTGVDLIVYQTVTEQVEKTFTATKWHVYRSDLGGMVNNPETGDSYVRTASRETSGELVTNGTFDTDLSGWTDTSELGGSSAYSSGTATLTSVTSGTGGRIEQSISTVIGRLYRLTADRPSGSVIIQAPSYQSDNGSGSISIEFTATSTSSNIVALKWNAGTSSVDNISVKEIDVNPATERYLPRVGHHIYNGTAWVNEGLLHESEARTNQMVYSGDLTDASWTSPRLTVGAVTAGSPFGTYQALTPINHGTTWAANAFQIGKPITFGATYVGWALAKYSAGSGWFAVNMYDTGRTSERAWFDLQNGVVGTKDALIVDHGMIDYGDGWWLCWASSNTNSNNGGLSLEVTNGDNVTTSSTSDTILIAGSQYEQGSTPSSYIPTVGATVTRAAETLTVPAANMPWPEPVFIGPELVTNGTFDTDSDWTKGTGWTIGSGVATHAAGTGSDLEQSGLTAGKLYVLTLDVTAVRAASTLYVVSNPNIYQIIGTTVTTGQKVATFIAPTNGKLSIRLGWPADVDIDNVSVKEINPLSVSIQMDGRMTYADNDTSTEVRPYFWLLDGTTYIYARVSTTTTRTGQPTFLQRQTTPVAAVYGGNSVYSAGTNVPFNFAGRYGSTFINGSHEGTLLTANTTPVALPDLSSTDFEIGKTFMGTIGGLRVWADDIGDAGIVEASSPSLEPSLSLTFDGLSTSFTVTDWSE